jgi:hypothetical protein
LEADPVCGPTIVALSRRVKAGGGGLTTAEVERWRSQFVAGDGAPFVGADSLNFR